MKHLKSIALAASIALLWPHLASAETYSLSPYNIPSGTQISDADGVFTVSVPTSLWVYSYGPIVGRNGTLYGRAISPSGKVTEFTRTAIPGGTLNFAGTTGIIEFYAIRHCYTYYGGSYQCQNGSANLTVVSKPVASQLSTVKPSVPSVDYYHGRSCLPNQSC